MIHVAEPAVRHEVRHLGLGLRAKRWNTVSNTNVVVEDEGYFCEVGDGHVDIGAVWQDIEAVAVHGKVVGGPDFTRLATRRDDRYVAEVSR